MLYWLKQFTDNTNHIIPDKAYSYYKIRQLTRITSNTRFDQKTPLFVHVNINTTTLTGFRTKLSNHKYHTGHTEVFGFDPASNRVPLPNTKTNTNQDIHNKTKRPTSLISQGKHITYSYDIHGNIKTKTETPIDKQGNQIAQSQNGLVGYRKSIEFSYNSNNELAKTLTLEDTGLTITKTTTQYHYDAFGRRIAKNSKVERLNKLNQNGQLVRYPTTLLHLSKTQKTQYQTTLMLWEGNRQIQEYAKDFVFTTVYDNQSFEPVARVVQSRQSQDNTHSNGNDKAELFKVYHYHNNHLGTPQELTDEQGEVIWCNYEYAWGGSYQDYYKEQSLNGIAIQDYELQPIKFQGQSLDIETGLHYNRFRYYDSDVGMFIQRDPIGLLGGWNVFAYAPNPVGWVDPFGLAKKSCGEIFNEKRLKIQALIDEHNYANRRNFKAKIPGGVSGAITYERTTGNQVEGRYHFEKGQNILEKLRKLTSDKELNKAISLCNHHKQELKDMAKPYIESLSKTLSLPQAPLTNKTVL